MKTNGVEELTCRNEWTKGKQTMKKVNKTKLLNVNRENTNKNINRK